MYLCTTKIVCCTVNEIWTATDIFFSHFVLLPPNNPEIKIFKKWNKSWRYHHFTHVYQNSCSYALLFLRYGMWQMQLLFFIMGYFLPFYTWRYHHFTHVHQKLWSDDVQFLRYGAWQMTRQMDGQKKWHIEVGVKPKKSYWYSGKNKL